MKRGGSMGTYLMLLLIIHRKQEIRPHASANIDYHSINLVEFPSFPPNIILKEFPCESRIVSLVMYE
jgi:hypothetical protein